LNRPDLLKDLNLSSFIAFDFETTGLDPVKDRLIEVAAIRFVDGVPKDKFITLVNPKRQLLPLIVDITGITDDMLVKAPEEKKIAADLISFLGNDPIVAHNLSFDLAFLNELIKRHNLAEIENELYDTLYLARTFMFNEASFSLGSLSDTFGFNLDKAHRAEYDADNCGKLFIELIQIASGYSLPVISQILEVIKPHDIFNKALFVSIGNALIKAGDTTKGLVPVHDYGEQPQNYYESNGKNNIADISPEEVFGENGFLSKSKDGYEYRSGQVSYSEFAVKVLENDPTIGVAEAGTGLGKTMAYLLPALRQAQLTGNPVVVSCHTKHLQDQLFHNDLPQLVNSVNASVKASLLKGRNNYICRTRFNWLIGNSKTMLNNQDAGKLISLIPWLSWTKTGDMSECAGFWNSYPGRLTSMIQSEPGYCTTAICQSHHGCFFGQIRQAVFGADLIIINHALLLSQTGGEGFLPHFESVIIDEGHNLVNVAYSQFSSTLDLRSILNGVKKFDPKDSHNSRFLNILTGLAKVAPEFSSAIQDLTDFSQDCQSAGFQLFKTLYEDFQIKYSYKSQYTRKVIMENLTEAYGDYTGDLHWLSNCFTKLNRKAEEVKNKILSIDPAGEEYGEFIKMLDYRMDIVAGLNATLSILTDDQKKDWVYWQESETRNVPDNRTGFLISLNGSPVDISSVLGPEFFRNIEHCLVTSATIRVDDSFNYFLARTGIDTVQESEVKTQTFSSPFSYEDQVNYLQYGGPQIISENPEALADYIYSLYQKQNNRIMVLFTARALLEKVYHALRNKPEGRDLPVFAQIRNSSRFALVQGMKKSKRGILLGTNAFWEGIDFPGDLLETLVITKLPFDVPTDPIVQSFSQLISRHGGNPFKDFSIPECVIRFRQGFGRLIRTTRDEGTFIVMDNRVVTKGYGRHLSDAIPVSADIFTDLY